MVFIYKIERIPRYAHSGYDVERAPDQVLGKYAALDVQKRA
jgi:hypothetical protein